jgi:hypothetical protein
MLMSSSASVNTFGKPAVVTTLEDAASAINSA